MTGPEEIAEVFGFLHDGCIAGGTKVERTAELVVEIAYLAERIRPGDRKLTIRMDGLTHVRFMPWTDEGHPLIPDVTDFTEITSLGLGVLSAEPDGQMVRIACTQNRPKLGYCGGIIEMAAGGCRVFDESHREWTLEDLMRLSDDYWSEWQAR